MTGSLARLADMIRVVDTYRVPTTPSSLRNDTYFVKVMETSLTSAIPALASSAFSVPMGTGHVI